MGTIFSRIDREESTPGWLGATFSLALQKLASCFSPSESTGDHATTTATCRSASNTQLVSWKELPPAIAMAELAKEFGGDQYKAGATVPPGAFWVTLDNNGKGMALRYFFPTAEARDKATDEFALRTGQAFSGFYSHQPDL